MRCALIGDRLGHSFSKEIHESLGRYDYELIELEPDELEGFIRSWDFDGLNVTMPFKQTIIPLLDEVSDLAAGIGAVNTVVNRGGRLSGFNTDHGGMKMLIERLGTDLSGKKAFIAGSGGTSMTAAMACRDLGASEIIRAGRTGRNGTLTYEEAYRLHHDAALLINATPAGMYPDTDGAAFDIEKFGAPEGVADVIYNPLATTLIRQARAKGIPAENGLYMVVAQAMLAAEKFTGEPVDESETERIYRKLTVDKSNIVLTGMPGSGKTTLGRLLAQKTGRKLIETDDEIVTTAGMPITEIFERYGEEHFRGLESEIIRRASETGGKIISTGGGAVLRKENVDSLRMNGIIVFLDRAPESLTPSDSRPLADSTEKIRKLYEERYQIYSDAADLTVDIAGSEESCADKIRRALR